jgi:cyanate lyase
VQVLLRDDFEPIKIAVIASQRSGRPDDRLREAIQRRCSAGLLRRFAPRNDEYHSTPCHYDLAKWRPQMKRSDLTEKLLDIKRAKGWTWKHICEEIGGMSPVLITGAVLGQMKMTKPQAAKAAELFGLTKSEEALLNEIPTRGSPMPPTDPLIYRFYELVMVNGPALKVLIEEEFGDGIMSAIDFDMAVERQPDPKGDRVRLSMSGKFLPYKYYGATGNAQAYGYKEE